MDNNQIPEVIEWFSGKVKPGQSQTDLETENEGLPEKVTFRLQDDGNYQVTIFVQDVFSKDDEDKMFYREIQKIVSSEQAKKLVHFFENYRQKGYYLTDDELDRAISVIKAENGELDDEAFKQLDPWVGESLLGDEARKKWRLLAYTEDGKDQTLVDEIVRMKKAIKDTAKENFNTGKSQFYESFTHEEFFIRELAKMNLGKPNTFREMIKMGFDQKTGVNRNIFSLLEKFPLGLTQEVLNEAKRVWNEFNELNEQRIERMREAVDRGEKKFI